MLVLNCPSNPTRVGYSMQELAAQDATELARRMNEVNERGQLTRTVPNAEKVAGWIAEAKSIPKVLDY